MKKLCKRGHMAEKSSSGGCKQCGKEGARRRLLADRDGHRASVRRWRTANKWRWRLIQWASQGLPLPTRPWPEVCELCGRPPGKTALNLDHCHTTGKFRGWLCNSCNTSLGKMGDSIEGVKQWYSRACSYLRREEP